MKNIKESNLRKAIYAYLYDNYDLMGLEIESPDEGYVEAIIQACIKQNDNTCPFKNYDCVGHCDSNMLDCVDGLKITCEREEEEIWREFMGIESEEETDAD